MWFLDVLKVQGLANRVSPDLSKNPDELRNAFFYLLSTTLDFLTSGYLPGL